MKSYWIPALLLSFLTHFLVILGIFFSPLAGKSRIRPADIKKIEIIPEKIIEKEKITKKKEFSRRYDLAKKEPLAYKENIVDKLLNLSKNLPGLGKIKQADNDYASTIFSNLDKKEKIKKSSAYMNYYRLIREKIRKKAYRNYGGREKGKVFLSFNVAGNGALKAVGLGEESVNNPRLKQIGIKSIKDSAPFPAFPAELKDYAQLQFNISIYFKND